MPKNCCEASGSAPGDPQGAGLPGADPTGAGLPGADPTGAGVPGLSCYTAALHGYLAAEWDAGALIARSVRLAVRPPADGGVLAFSHHEPSLDLLPDGSRLRYAGCPTSADALPEVAAELARHDRVVVLVDSARLPWSVTLGGPAAPHWLLVEGRDRRGWQVRDDFTALLPAGEQLPYRGELDTESLAEAMTLPRQWQPVHLLRNRLAFGAPLPVPSGGALWLHRHRDPAAPATLPAGAGWLVGDAQVLPFLSEYAADAGPAILPHLDDLWAAAGHRSFAYRWRLRHGDAGSDRINGESDRSGGGFDRAALEAALPLWESLPRLLRVAVESAARGRPRHTLVRSALLQLRELPC